MRFMVMHKVDAHMEAGEPPSERIIQQMGSYVQGSIQKGVFKDGAGLHRSAQRVRLVFQAGKRTVTRGPLQGGNELLASFAMITATSMEHAIEIATRVAGALGDGEIEIGPVVEPWDIGVMQKPANPPARFLLLRKADRAFEAGASQPAGLRAVMDQLTREGVLLSGATLLPSAKGARYRKVGGERAWTDGPFAESKELVAGFSLIELPSLAEARRWAEAYADILGDNEVDVRQVAEA
ncbi:MAG TPA: YciI family protein [Kofleriaceae bacterium]|nr:YciI family protein [Kofleriaceae bacterium]